MSTPSVLFVHAHPDDEALWTGGTTVAAAEAGWRVAVLTCTWTEGTRRYEELCRSLDFLGAGAPRLLRYADAGVPESAPDELPFCRADLDTEIGALVAQIRAFRPDVVVTYDGYGVYGHPDHIHTHRIVVAAVDDAALGVLYPDAGPAWHVSSLYMVTPPKSLARATWERTTRTAAPDDDHLPGTDDDRIDVEVDVRPYLDRKWSALMSHESEIRRSSALRILTALDAEQRAYFIGTESYLRRDLGPGGLLLPGAVVLDHGSEAAPSSLH